MQEHSQLNWVLYQEVLHDVSDFAGLDKKNRPIVYCPVCSKRVILRLGDIRVHHAAHYPDSNCILTNNESVIHFNAKHLIAKELVRYTDLRILDECAGFQDRICADKNSRIVEFLRDWDEVKVEYTIDQYRPDIVLLNEGIPIGAIEVFVTHSLEPEKEDYLKELNIPWIEVEGSKILRFDAKGNKWDIGKPMPTRKRNFDFFPIWHCENCRKKWKDANRHDISGNSAVRIIDFYFDNGKVERKIYFARSRIIYGKIAEYCIIDRDENTIISIEDPDESTDKRKIHSMFEDYLSEKHHTMSVLIDGHMSWQVCKGNNVWIFFEKEYQQFLFPHRYRWNWASNSWEKNEDFSNMNWNNFFDSTERLGYRIEKMQKERDGESIERDIYVAKNVAECIYCHERTTDWWFYDPISNTCKCNVCYYKNK